MSSGCWLSTCANICDKALEDSLFISRGKLAESNAQQVTKIRRIVEDLGCEVATPDEAREILDLKGGDRVNF